MEAAAAPANAEGVLRGLVELCEKVRENEEEVCKKIKRGTELVKRLRQLKETLVLRVHDCARHEGDQHVQRALESIREDVAGASDLLDKVDSVRIFPNKRLGRKVDTRIRDLVTDGMSLATALAMACVASSRQSTVDEAVKQCKAIAAKATPPPAPPAAAPAAVEKEEEQQEEEEAEEEEEEEHVVVDEDGEGVGESEAMELERLALCCQEGNQYLLGTGVEKDLERALTCFMKAAGAGYAPAQFQVGAMNEFGLGTPVNFDEALRWYAEAAERELPEALFALANISREGRCGVEQDLGKAVSFFERAAKQGHLDALFFLGAMHERGEGVAADPAEALKWYLQGANLGHRKAQCNAGALYFTGRGTERNLADAFQWFVESAKQNYPQALVNLGVMYQTGAWVDVNKDRAAELFVKAVQLGHRPALLPLARLLVEQEEVGQARLILEEIGDQNAEALYLLGTLHMERPEEAVIYFRRAADMRYPPAITQMATYHFNEIAGLPRDMNEVVRLYAMAAEMGDAEAQLELGTLYLEGTCVPQSYVDAAKWFTMAAEQDSVLALYSLAELYEQGNGVPRDPSKAADLFEKSRQLGHPLSSQIPSSQHPLQASMRPSNS